MKQYDVITYELVKAPYFRNAYRLKLKSRKCDLLEIMQKGLYAPEIEGKREWARNDFFEVVDINKYFPEPLFQYKNNPYIGNRYNTVTIGRDRYSLPTSVCNLQSAIIFKTKPDHLEFCDDVIALLKEKYWNHEFIYSIINRSSGSFADLRNFVKQKDKNYVARSYDEMKSGNVFHKIFEPKDFEFCADTVYKSICYKGGEWFSGAICMSEYLNEFFNDNNLLISGDNTKDILVRSSVSEMFKIIGRHRRIPARIKKLMESGTESYGIHYVDEETFEFQPAIDISEYNVTESAKSYLFNEMARIFSGNDKLVFYGGIDCYNEIVNKNASVEFHDPYSRVGFGDTAEGKLFTINELCYGMSSYSNETLKDVLKLLGKTHSYTKEILLQKIIEACIEKYEEFVPEIEDNIHGILIAVSGNTYHNRWYGPPKNLLYTIFEHVYINLHLRNDTVVDPSWKNNSVSISEIINNLVLYGQELPTTYIRADPLKNLIGAFNVNKN